MKLKWTILLMMGFVFIPNTTTAQEEDLTAIELSMDQDFLADFLHDDPEEPFNYTTGLRLGIYGELANHVYLGLPYVRQKLDDWIVDPFLDWIYFRDQDASHNFVMTINGFSPTLISDETQLFTDTTAAGYRLADDIPFSSFTGFRSSRRVEAYKMFAHSASEFEMAITSSFTFGFMSLGTTRGVENLFGTNRPNGNLWERDENKPYPTGPLHHTLAPVLLYSLSMETVLWRPMRKVLLQVRPEINLGYYTDLGIGFDFGKVMNTNRFIDNLSYTDTHNPGMVSINDADFSFSLVAGGMARAVLYNAHLHGMFGWEKGTPLEMSDTRKYLLEAYVGAKLQFVRKVEVNFSINTRSSPLKGDPGKYSIWGTLGMKYLLGSAGEGCYTK